MPSSTPLTWALGQRTAWLAAGAKTPVTTHGCGPFT